MQARPQVERTQRSFWSGPQSSTTQSRGIPMNHCCGARQCASKAGAKRSSLHHLDDKYDSSGQQASDATRYSKFLGTKWNRSWNACTEKRSKSPTKAAATWSFQDVKGAAVDNHSQHFEELTLSLSSAQVASLSSH